MVYRVSQTFGDISEVDDFLEELGAENYRIIGSTAKLGPHPENRRRAYSGESFNMDLDEMIDELVKAPSTNYKVSLSYSSDPKVAVTAKVGPLPSITVRGEHGAFNNFEQFRDFLEGGRDWT